MKKEMDAAIKKMSTVLVAALLCFACTLKDASRVNPEDHLVIYENLIADFELAEKWIPTRKIDFNETSSFVMGWSGFKNGSRWAVGRKSELAVNLLGRSDLEMSMVCKPFWIHQEQQQFMDIYLNQAFIKKISLDRKERSYLITLPSSLIKKGENRLQFRYAYAQQPPPVNGKKIDKRKLSVQFKHIEFQATDDHLPRYVLENRQKQIFQQIGTLLKYYYHIPADCHLDIEAQITNPNLTGMIEVTAQDQKALTLSLNKSGTKRISLKKYANQHVCLTLQVKEKKRLGAQSESRAGPKVMAWSKLALSTPKGDYYAMPHRLSLQTLRDKIRKLDIVYIVLDAFNARHASLYGYHRKTTPFLEKLSEKALVFNHFYANHPYTLASTATLLTSKYSFEHGLINNKKRLGPILPTFPEVLAENGIDTFLITGHNYLLGGWGLNRGFTKVIHDQLRWVKNRNIKKLEQIYATEYAHNQKFIYMHLMPPHAPYDPPQKYRIFTDKSSKYEAYDLKKLELGQTEQTEAVLAYIKGLYDANVLFADDIIKEIHAFLESRDALKNTILIVTSDHGEAFLEHGRMEHNTTVYEEMIHIPLIMLFPEETGIKGQKIENLYSIIDFFPTLLDMLSIESDIQLSGSSMLPALIGRSKHDRVYAETLLTKHRSLIEANYKLLSTPEKLALYDLDSDPFETRNIFRQKPFLAGTMAQEMKLFQTQAVTDNKNDVDLEKLDAQTVQQLKELGYLR